MAESGDGRQARAPRGRHVSNPAFRRGRRAQRVIRRGLSIARAADAVGTIESGCEIFGLTKGDYSLIDLIEHCLDTTGPADVVVSTWSAAGADLEFARGFVADGRVRRLRFVVDYTFIERQPEYVAVMRERFGDEAIRLTRNHAKFVVVSNDEWALCLRSSMNLNENKRMESWELSDDRGMADYLLGVVESLFASERGAVQLAKRAKDHKLAFTSWFGDEVRDRDVRRAGWTSQKTGKRIG
jgi:hypothetical protein